MTVLASTDGPAAWAAIHALAERPEAESLALLVELAQSTDLYRRRAAVEAIGRHQSGAEAEGTVRGLLDDLEGTVARAACEAAARLRLRTSHDRVFELAGANEEATRLVAIGALDSLWQPSDFEHVFDRYRQDRSTKVRKQAAWVLRNHADIETWDSLFPAWAGDSLPRHRVWACELAERFGTSALLPSLESLSNDSNGHVRTAAGRAVAKITSSSRLGP